jgi:hypothetical protein
MISARMPPYKELFPVGSRVKIGSREQLEAFQRTWKYHHPLLAEQLGFAGRDAIVRHVGYYHGGDVLYELNDTPGMWHEQCLSHEDR